MVTNLSGAGSASASTTESISIVRTEQPPIGAASGSLGPASAAGAPASAPPSLPAGCVAAHAERSASAATGA